MIFQASLGVALLAAYVQAGVLYTPWAPSYAPPVGNGYNYAQQYDFSQGQDTGAANNPAPTTSNDGYSFNYDIAGPDGRQSRQESGDGSGNVDGQYSFTLNDGRKRNVRYKADADGFKASIESNEQGVDTTSAPAGVTFLPVSGQLPTGPAPAQVPLPEKVPTPGQVPLPEKVPGPTQVPVPAGVAPTRQRFAFLAVPILETQAKPWQ